MKFVICIFLFVSFQTVAKQISDLNWKKRLLIISYSQIEFQIFTKVNKFIDDNKCKIDDRNIEIIFYNKFKNQKFITPKFIMNKYGIWLIGYDGQIKDYSPNEEIFVRLFDVIDSMPMRKNEITNSKC